MKFGNETNSSGKLINPRKILFNQTHTPNSISIIKKVTKLQCNYPLQPGDSRDNSTIIQERSTLTQKNLQIKLKLHIFSVIQYWSCVRYIYCFKKRRENDFVWKNFKKSIEVENVHLICCSTYIFTSKNYHKKWAKKYYLLTRFNIDYWTSKMIFEQYAKKF